MTTIEQMSIWLRAGDPPCEGCSGRGRLPGDPDLCSACMGWGRADPDPGALDGMPTGAICSACGMPPDLDDPVLIDPAGLPVHWSHLAAARQRYLSAIAALTAPGPAGAEIGQAPAGGEQRCADYRETPDGAFNHIAGRWQDVLSRLRIKVPRALCGVSLAAGPGEPDLGPDAPACPECRWRCDISLIGRFRNRWRTCGWCGEPAATGGFCRQCRGDAAEAASAVDGLADDALTGADVERILRGDDDRYADYWARWRSS